MPKKSEIYLLIKKASGIY